MSVATTLVLAGLIAQSSPVDETTIPATILDAEKDRVETIARVQESVLSIFQPDGGGGGSGVLISPDGFALTNYHVTGPNVWLKCGLPDGRVYDAVLVGTDPVGDVSLVRLVGRSDFPFSSLGDSDRLRLGEPVLAMGNPFLLAVDFTPTITLGVISGLHRYQAPTNGVLEYTDCIQTDASINPGNSGGPLFNLNGEVIGINGRISLEKRGRLNVGVAYAISSNQVKNFLEHLRGGLIVEHAGLGAVVRTAENGQVTVTDILETSDAYRRGLREGDEILSFAGRGITSANDLKNILGTIPTGWDVGLTYRRRAETVSIRIRLTGAGIKLPEQPVPSPKFIERLPKDVRSRYEAAAGFANAYFNAVIRDQLLASLQQPEIAGRRGLWTFDFEDENAKRATLVIGDDQALWKRENESAAYTRGEEAAVSMDSPEAFLLAADAWRTMLLDGHRWFSRCDFAGGFPNAEGTIEQAIRSERSGIEGRWTFAQEDHRLTGVEVSPGPSADRCQIRLSDYRRVGEVVLPHRWDVTLSGRHWATLTLQSAELSP